MAKEPTTCRNHGCENDTGGPSICGECHEKMCAAYTAAQEEEHNLPKLEQDDGETTADKS